MYFEKGDIVRSNIHTYRNCHDWEVMGTKVTTSAEGKRITVYLLSSTDPYHRKRGEYQNLEADVICNNLRKIK